MWEETNALCWIDILIGSFSVWNHPFGQNCRFSLCIFPFTSRKVAVRYPTATSVQFMTLEIESKTHSICLKVAILSPVPHLVTVTNLKNIFDWYIVAREGTSKPTQVARLLFCPRPSIHTNKNHVDFLVYLLPNMHLIMSNIESDECSSSSGMREGTNQ